MFTCAVLLSTLSALQALPINKKKKNAELSSFFFHIFKGIKNIRQMKSSVAEGGTLTAGPRGKMELLERESKTRAAPRGNGGANCKQLQVISPLRNKDTESERGGTFESGGI